MRDIMFKGSFESLKIYMRRDSPVGDPHPGVPGPVEQLLRLVGARPGHQPHGGLVQEQSEQFIISVRQQMFRKSSSKKHVR